MKADLVAKLRCPARECGSPRLSLQATSTQTLHYRAGPIDEVREGSIICEECGRSYPISEYVVSFEQIFPAELLKEADYWAKWYGFMWDKGYYGYFDLRAPMAPLITEGIDVLDPARLERKDIAGEHSILAEHSLIKRADDILDIGCGTGWSSLDLARRGHNVVAFDPSAQNMRLAKRYAIAQGEYIEYIGAAIGYLAFNPETFGAVISLYALHHVPHLERELEAVRSWLRADGAIGVAEHLRDDPTLQALFVKLYEWASREVYPGLRTLDLQELYTSLPQAPHSELEGAGSKDIISGLLKYFHLESLSSRYYSLDSFSLNYYLAEGLDKDAHYHAARVIDRIYRLYSQAYPEGAELVTLVARKKPDVTALHERLAREALAISAGPVEDRELGILRAAVEVLQDQVTGLQETIAIRNKQIEELEGWATSMEHALIEQRAGGTGRKARQLLRFLRRN
jgi:2-polyprenyl-3-methyl-5-hydroxy-6-metoxy-1,4-benzoquinol methylase